MTFRGFDNLPSRLVAAGSSLKVCKLDLSDNASSTAYLDASPYSGAVWNDRRRVARDRSMHKVGESVGSGSDLLRLSKEPRSQNAVFRMFHVIDLDLRRDNHFCTYSLA